MSEVVLVAPTKTSVSECFRFPVTTYIQFWLGRNIILFY
jgi:hypothetical protein